MMTVSEKKTLVLDLAAEAFEAFCEDIGGMFAVDMSCEVDTVTSCCAKDLKKKYKKIVAINAVKSDGALNGNLKFIFDHEALFTLGGVIVMLPQNRIVELRRTGQEKDAIEIADAIGEMGNMLVGSWNRVFRKGFNEQIHFVQSDTFIGNPWDNPQEKIDMSPDEQYFCTSHKIKIDTYPEFKCCVLLPESMLSEQVSSVVEAAAEEQPETVEIVNIAESEAENVIEEDVITQPQEAVVEIPVETQVQADDVKQEITETQTQIESKLPDVESQVEQIKGPISSSIEQMSRSSAILPGESCGGTFDKSAFFGLCASDIMSKNIYWIGPEQSVAEALKLMQQHDTKYLLVGSDGNLQAMLSSSDVSSAVSVYLRPMFAKFRRPLDDATMQIKVKCVATMAVKTVKTEMKLDVLIDRMCRYSIRALPVVDNNGKIQGLITASEILTALLNSK